MENRSSFYFLQEIISDLKSNDKNITNFNRVFQTLGFSMPFCRPHSSSNDEIYRLSSAFVAQWKAEVNGKNFTENFEIADCYIKLFAVRWLPSNQL